jgi:3-dehydroquinate dehydratase-2
MRILILNGPNLNLLGKRDKGHYGVLDLSGLEDIIRGEFIDARFEFRQSNLEGELIGWVQAAEADFDGVILNPGGYAHTSVALRDALAEIKIPKIEVHLSNIFAREDFRHTLITASACDGCISGFKENSYLSAVYILLNNFKKRG